MAGLVLLSLFAFTAPAAADCETACLSFGDVETGHPRDPCTFYSEAQTDAGTLRAWVLCIEI